MCPKGKYRHPGALYCSLFCIDQLSDVEKKFCKLRSAEEEVCRYYYLSSVHRKEWKSFHCPQCALDQKTEICGICLI